MIIDTTRPVSCLVHLSGLDVKTNRRLSTLELLKIAGDRSLFVKCKCFQFYSHEDVA